MRTFSRPALVTGHPTRNIISGRLRIFFLSCFDKKNSSVLPNKKNLRLRRLRCCQGDVGQMRVVCGVYSAATDDSGGDER